MGGVLESPVCESAIYDRIVVIACVKTKTDRKITTEVIRKSHCAAAAPPSRRLSIMAVMLVDLLCEKLQGSRPRQEGLSVC